MPASKTNDPIQKDLDLKVRAFVETMKQLHHLIDNGGPKDVKKAHDLVDGLGDKAQDLINLLRP